MSSSKPVNRGLRRVLGRTILGLAVSVVLATSSAASRADNLRILPINSHPYGKTYGEWSVAWWQWAFSIPAASNPILDTTGAFAGVGQSGPVWFLGGTFGSSEERTVTIPAGKGIFMGVHQWIFGASVFDCDPSNPGVPCDIPTLRAAAAAAVDSVQTLIVTIDGRDVPNIRQYRAVSPDPFSVTFPEDAIFGFPAGTFAPHVADGYWLMLAPLQPGTHTILIRVTNPDYGVDNTVITHITVKGGETPVSNGSE